jgi:hypothetical protein
MSADQISTKRSQAQPRLSPHTRQYRWFGFAVTGALLFILLTAAAMLIYPGGTPTEPTRQRYSFFVNFFSDLGRTRTFTGQPNRESQILFTMGVMIGGAAMAYFFRAFAGCTAGCWKQGRRTAVHLSRSGALLGTAAGICFIGVAFTPWDIYLGAHMVFVLWAFRLFLGAVVLNLLAVMLEPGLPRRTAWVFATFAMMLIAYLILLSAGLAGSPAATAMVQATGQKIIVYAAIITVLVQSLEMRRHLFSKK